MRSLYLKGIALGHLQEVPRGDGAIVFRSLIPELSCLDGRYESEQQIRDAILVTLPQERLLDLIG